MRVARIVLFVSVVLLFAFGSAKSAATEDQERAVLLVAGLVLVVGIPLLAIAGMRRR